MFIYFRRKELPEISEIIPGTLEFRLRLLEIERKPAECPVRYIHKFISPVLILVILDLL